MAPLPADSYRPYDCQAVAIILACWELHAASHAVGRPLLRSTVEAVVAPRWRPRALQALERMEREVAA